MDSITVSNYRCFGERQTARLAPLTLFIGENSSGKTSLAAMIRALWDVAYAERVPDFKEAPYDLGSFDEIVHHGDSGGGGEDSFEAGFEVVAGAPRRVAGEPENLEAAPYKLEVTFGPQWGAPAPIRRRISRGGCWVEQLVDKGGQLRVEFGTPRGSWSLGDPGPERLIVHNGGVDSLPPFFTILHLIWRERSLAEDNEETAGAPAITEEDEQALMDLMSQYDRLAWPGPRPGLSSRPFAGAPTRSHPRRTYDPASVAPDAEGDHVPMYLAQLSRRDPDAWMRLKSRLDEFGREAGLFDAIDVRDLGKAAGDPFQIRVRTSDIQQAGSLFNLADVGYGVSQVLPLVTELLRDDGHRMILLQQPEVHLHPSAEAALGSLLCRVAAAGKERGRRLVVETHSDFIIDRVCMAVRDGAIGLRPEDVSIVYFERCELDVCLHPISLDDLGNLIDTPPGYRRFFMDESLKFLGV